MAAFVKERCTCEGIMTVCGIIKAKNGDINDDISAQNPNDWGDTSHRIHLDFGEKKV